MNKLEASLEVLMLGISSELISSRQPQEQVRHTLELLQKIYVRIDTIEQSQLNQGIDLRKFRSEFINLLKITVLRESFATIELSQKIDKLLEYLEAIYQQIPLDFLVESTENLNNPPLHTDSPTDGTFDISFPPLNLGTNPPWTFRGSNKRSNFTEFISGTEPPVASSERREFTNFIPSTEPPFMTSSEGMDFIESTHGTDPHLL